MKLLIVDDDAFLRDMYAIKFSESGYDVAVAETAEQALDVIAKSPDFRVILLDMVMPGMGGVELIETIKSTFPDMKADLIVLSNQGQESDVAEATRVGASGYIVKAESIPSDVVAKVAKLTGKKQE